MLKIFKRQFLLIIFCSIALQFGGVLTKSSFAKEEEFRGLGFKLRIGPEIEVFRKESWHLSHYKFIFKQKLFLHIQSGHFPGLSEENVSPPSGTINGMPYKCVIGNDIKGRSQKECILNIGNSKSNFLKFRYPLSDQDVAEKFIFSLKKSEAPETVQIPSGLPETPLHSAALTNDIEKARKLILDGAKVNAISSNKSTPLHYAVVMGHRKMVELLVSNEADVNAIGHPLSNQGTPLQGICSDQNKNYTAIADFLIKHDAKLHIKSSNGTVPILKAAGWCSFEVFKLLLDHGANPFAEDIEGNTILHFAAQRSRDEPHFKDRLAIVKILIEKGLDINSENIEGITPLDIIKAARDKELEEIIDKIAQ